MLLWRQILDASLIANEVINSLLKNNNCGIICKLNIEKIYDHVNWNFLLMMLEKMGFEDNWINWCIPILNYFVLINGSP